MFLTYDTYTQLVKESNNIYWLSSLDIRWDYLNVAINYCIKNNYINNIIEAGTGGLYINDKSFIFDLPKHDLEKLPLKFKDNEFNVFVAFQVWEHLINKKEILLEAFRISNCTIISVPYMWDISIMNKEHANINLDTILEWSNNIKPTHTEIVGKELKRIVCIWDKNKMIEAQK